MKIDDSNIKKTIKYLNNDECVNPTETVYGLQMPTQKRLYQNPLN